MTVFGGALIAVGVSIFDNYGLLASFGAGLDYCVCAGLMVHIGTALNQFSGPLTLNMIGGYAFLGAGTYVAIGSPAVSTMTTIQEAGIVSIGGGREGGRAEGCLCLLLQAFLGRRTNSFLFSSLPFLPPSFFPSPFLSF
jgi:hypothetical protein